MDIREWGVEHFTWKEGWPQPGEEEKGNEGVEVNGGHENGDLKASGFEEQAFSAVQSRDRGEHISITTMATRDIDVKTTMRFYFHYLKSKPIWAKSWSRRRLRSRNWDMASKLPGVAQRKERDRVRLKDLVVREWTLGTK